MNLSSFLASPLVQKSLARQEQLRRYLNPPNRKIALLFALTLFLGGIVAGLLWADELPDEPNGAPLPPAFPANCQIPDGQEPSSNSSPLELAHLLAYLSETRRDHLLALLNEGTKDQLLDLQGIAASKATAIEEARPFAEITDVLRVSGIGEGTLVRILRQETWPVAPYLP